ncbi:MAG: HipA N-terminal domain-containing protein [Endomicrobiales bacterium]|nr:HipA N-terminal domain-containing protein [Endomicrobiales bacterium]
MTERNRRAMVLFNNMEAGKIEETSFGYRFQYNEGYILNKGQSISVSLPLKKEPYESAALFSFFEGLLPEGWYLDTVASTLKIDKNDSFGILLATCKDTAGAVSIMEIK